MERSLFPEDHSPLFRVQILPTESREHDLSRQASKTEGARTPGRPDSVCLAIGTCPWSPFLSAFRPMCPGGKHCGASKAGTC